MGGHVAAESQLQTPSGCDESSGKVDKLLNNRLDPAALGLVTDDTAWFHQGDLTDETQDVVHQGATGHHQVVGGKLSRRQPLQVHVGLDFGMILLTEGMPFVQLDDLLVGKRKACPPAFKFNVGYKQHLPLFVDGSLGNPHDPAQGNGSLYPVGISEGVFLLHTEHRDPFAGTRCGNLTVSQGVYHPCVLVLFAGIPFDDEVQAPVPGEFRQIGNGIMG